jgi:lipooligosaccharide transport system permease protein
MLTLLAAPRVLLRDARGSTRRALAVTGRNATLARHAGYWWVLVSGFFEPVLYLLSIGVGVGHLVGTVTLAPGRVVSYSAFVAPAMLASSAMNGALSESVFQFFAKMRQQRLYDSVLATPVTAFEIALGELVWSLVRGAVYAAAFLGIMVATGLTAPGPALLALPATALVGFAFGGLGSALATMLRGWQDFDYVTLVAFAMFLFSGTFAQVQGYPAGVRWAIEVLPLHHGVELVRGVTSGAPLSGLVGHLVYLVVMAVVGLVVAGRRMSAVLCK